MRSGEDERCERVGARVLGGTIAVLALILSGLVWSPPVRAADSIVAVDTFGDVGSYTSLALDPSGRPVVSYYDAWNGDLKLARCGTPSCSEGNLLTTIDSAGFVGMHSSLAIDSAGNPVVSYYDATNRSVKLARCEDASCTAHTAVSLGGGVREAPISLVLDRSGNPVVAYSASVAVLTPFPHSVAGLLIARCADAACAGGANTQLIDQGGVGDLSAVALDAAGIPVIAYYDQANGALKLARCGDVDCISRPTISTIESTSGVGFSISLALDAAGNPRIAYADLANADLKIATCADASCTNPRVTTVDSDGFVGYWPSLALDHAGNPAISYHDGGSLDLKLVRCGDADCASGNRVVTVDSIGLVGQFSSLALDRSGNPVVSYYDGSAGDLKLARCDDLTCATPPCGGLAVTIDMNSNGGVGIGTAGNDVILGTTGNDVILGHGGDDVICGGSGVDTVSGGEGDDIIYGGAGDDALFGDDGDDELWGDAGSDYLVGMVGADEIHGGDDADRLFGDIDRPAVGDQMRTSDGRDYIYGDGGDDEIYGGFAVDRIWGGAGADTIYGEGGSDRIHGDSGNDIVFAGSGADRVWGGSGNDTVNGMGGQDFIWGQGGNDTLQGNWQSDNLWGGPGDDDLRGAGGKDKLWGDTGNDELYGGLNTDYLNGGPGIDFGHGQRGKDNPLVPGVSGCEQLETKASC